MFAQEAYHIERQSIFAQMIRQTGLHVVAEVVNIGVLQINLHDIGVVRVIFFLRQLG